VLHPLFGDGADFKLLGVVMDAKLAMGSAVDNILKKAAPKLKALLRTRPYFSVTRMMRSYAAHILCLLEGATGAVYHASRTVLERLDRLQDKFVSEMGLDRRSAFLEHNLAPLGLRRDVAMLGLLYRRVHGLAHPALCRLFPPAMAPAHRHHTRLASRRHDRQLDEQRLTSRLWVVRRSIFGLVRV